VYKAALIDGGHNNKDYGEVMAWNDGKVKVKLCVKYEFVKRTPF